MRLTTRLVLVVIIYGTIYCVLYRVAVWWTR